MEPLGVGWARVLAVPDAHPYVDRLHGVVARLVGRDDGLGVVRPWDAAWIEANAMAWDVAHLHLHAQRSDLPPSQWPAGTAAGPDPSPEQILSAVRAHRAAGVPVVVTVHAIDTTDDPGGHRTIDVLRRAGEDVAAVITLTRGCADHLAGRLGRPVRAIPHGPLVGPRTRSRLRAVQRRTTGADRPLLLPLGDLSPSTRWREALAAIAAADRAARVQVAADRVDEVAAAARQVGAVRAVVEPPAGDLAALADVMAGADAVVLVSDRGCHSTLVELAADVGTPVIATDVGWRCQQQPTIRVPLGPDGDVDVAALAEVLSAPLPSRLAVTECQRERDDHAFRSHHQRLYQRLVLGQPDQEPALTA